MKENLPDQCAAAPSRRACCWKAAACSIDIVEALCKAEPKRNCRCRAAGALPGHGVESAKPTCWLLDSLPGCKEPDIIEVVSWKDATHLMQYKGKKKLEEDISGCVRPMSS